MENRIWTKLTARVGIEDLDCACAVMGLLDNGLMIEDYSDFALDGMYGELADESILEADRTHASVSLFVPAERPLPEYVAFLRERFAALGVVAELSTEGMAEEDWSESWKQYYTPIRLGKLTVVPAWQTDYVAAPEETVIYMDPGMAFGTGTHETTRLVLGLLEQHIRGGERFLDVGCGSGILSVAAAALGADFCAAYDIDPVAVAVTADNIRKSGYSNIICGTSDLLHSVDLSGGKYDFCVANIVADILLRMLPDLSGYLKEGGSLILSGIIEDRTEDITAALDRLGYTLLAKEELNGWVALYAKRGA